MNAEKDSGRKKLLLFGVVNITPDSFSDGGNFLDPSRALDRCFELCEQGADVLDLGAESTKPGTVGITPVEEWSRLQPLLDKIANSDLQFRVQVSIDSLNSQTIQKAHDVCKVDFFNSVGGLPSPDTLKFLASREISVVVMHRHGTSKSMQDHPLSEAGFIKEFFEQVLDKTDAAGMSAHSVWVDPGVGFGKNDAVNFAVLQESIKLSSKYNVLVGVSRKSFIGRALQIEDPEEREKPSKMLELGLMLSGIRAIRTHEVGVLHKVRELLNL